MGGRDLSGGLSRAELARVADYLSSQLQGARVQKVRQTQEHAVLLECRAPGKTHYLLFSAHHRFPRVMPVADRPDAPAATSAFCLLLRKRLAGGKIVELAADPRDRIFTFSVIKRDEEGEEEVWTLVAELFGPKSNLLLLSPEGKIVEVLLAKRLAARKLAVGEMYQLTPPPAMSDKDRGLEISEMAEAFTAAEQEYEFETLAARLNSALARELKRLRKYLGGIREEMSGLPDADRLSKQAEILLAYLPQVRKGQREAALPDWNDPDGGTMTIPLDPSKTPPQNAEQMFKTARRTRRKAENLRARLAEMETRAGALTEIEKELKAASSLEALQAAEDRLAAAGIKLAREKGPAARKGKEVARGPQPFLAADGAQIYVGRNAEENDELTFSLARGNDFWLHVEGAPSSHVIIKLPPGKELASETLLDAATLTLLHSSVKSAGAGAVLYTRCKNVRRVKGAPPGKVQAANTKSIYVRVDQTRVARLYLTRT